VVLWLGANSFAQQTVGLFQNDEGSFNGYTLFGTLTLGQTHLIDNEGRLIQQWTSSYPTGNTVYLLSNGDLLRAGRFEPTPQPRFNAGGRGGRIERFDWDGTLVWDFIYASADFRHHHDIAPLPNGNVLLIAWELKDMTESIQAGRNPAFLTGSEIWPETIVEIEPVGATGGNVVWEWHLWDHLVQDFDPTKDNFGVVADHPEWVDINFLNGESGQPDWLHANAIDYNPARDEIVIGLPFIDEIWVIDHSTTTAEAAGHTGGVRGKGGDILYRWGNPQSYGRGTTDDRRLWNQHDTEWIDEGVPGAGNILVFNNGPARPGGNFSSIDEINPPIDVDGNYIIAAASAYGPGSPTETYTATPPTSFFAGFLSSAQRLPNGNTLIDNGPLGNFFEVQPDGTQVWRYVNPVAIAGPVAQETIGANRAFRAERYAPDYPGLIGKDLTPGDLLELFTAPFPVPDGSGATTPLSASRQDAAGSTLNVQWDTTACLSFDYELLFGNLSDVGSYAPIGSVCSIGISGSFDWPGVPAADLYFLVLGIDNTGVYESSWGHDSAGAERNGASASGECNATNKVTTESCP
jgi:hypothetical protein